MPLPALLLIIATLLPLASFLILMFLGKRMGNPLAGYVGTAMIGGSFVCSLIAMMLWLTPHNYHDPHHGSIEYGAGKGPINLPMKWIPIGHAGSDNGLAQDHPGYLDIGVYVDSLTILMFAMITLVATLVHVFSIGYMSEDKRFARFFTYLGLFCFSMLGLVIGGTALHLFIFWELVGLCSYLLIGFWYEKKSASNAAIKAFVTNRVGDFGFLIGFGVLFYHVGNVSLPNMWSLLGAAGNGHAITLPGGMVFTTSMLTIMGIGLFFGAIGKSAQFPLHVWLPDAMEGPTPVSALIHAATMVAAGVYLVGRIFPILTPDARLFIAIIGLVTLTMAALIAIAQSDIKKVLAFSTLSQLGYMILAMGVGSWVGGLFHLITHAFFKALLFLGSGSVIHAAHHEQEMPQYGGLIRKIPVTGITFGIAVLAIAGTPMLSGFFSKDLILHHAAAFATLATDGGKSKLYWLFFILPTFIAYVTAFYMTRCWMLTFWGKSRNQHLYDHAHESPVLYIPLCVLALFSIFAGYYVVPQLLNNSMREATTYCQRSTPAFAGFNQAWPAAVEVAKAGEAPEEKHAAAHGHSAAEAAYEKSEEHVAPFRSLLFYGFLGGIGCGFLIYRGGYNVATKLHSTAPLGWIHTWLYRRMYFDELYFAVFVSIVMGLSRLAAFFDKYVVDGLVNLAGWSVRGASNIAGMNDKYIVDGAVNGAATLAQNVGVIVRSPQTGRVRMYVTMLMVAVALGLAGAIIVVLSH
jgi:NADH-quinone oxidoreductase subunit L